MTVDRPRGADVTAREDEVLTLLGERLTNAEIAERLYISERTVESHVSSLLRKLGAAHRRELAEHRSPPTATATDDTRLPPAIELLADAGTFVGRAAERAALDERWQLACSGHTLLVLVTGEAGIGKSRLVSEFAVDVHADGGKVLLGSCFEDVDEPYGPFVRAMVADASAGGGDLVRRSASAAGAALAPLAPELSELFDPVVEDLRVHDADDSERGIVVEAILDWLTASADAVPLLLVLEDLHWSTSTTREVLRHLVRRGGRSPLLIIGTARDSKPDLDSELSGVIAEMERSAAFSRVPLRGLNSNEVAALARDTTNPIDVIVAETRGNPLLVTHLTSDARSGTLPIWLYQRDRLLDDSARDVLDQAATFGTEFDADLLAAALGAPLLEVLESLEAAEAAGLVVAHPSRRAGFAFVHALFRSHRYREFPPTRRLRLHANAAVALASRLDDERLLAERARHTCLGVPVSDPREAVGLALRAAAHDEASYAYDEAVAHYRRGLEAARSIEPADPTTILELSIRLGAALHHRGDPEGLPMLIDAGRRADAAGDAQALVRAAISIPQFGAVGFVDPFPEARSLTEAALESLEDGPSPEGARLLVDLASHWLFVDVEEAIDLARRAEAMAAELGDPNVLGSVLLAARHLYSHPGRIDDRVRIGTELEAVGRRVDRLAFTLAALATQAATHLERGDLESWMERYERFCDRLGDRNLGFFQLQAKNHAANRAFLAGDLARAEELAELTVPLSVGIGAGRVYAESTIVANRRLQDRDGELLARFERAAARSDDAWYRCSLAAVQARAGHARDALATLDVLRGEGFPIRQIYPWAIAVTDLAEAAEVAGDAATAEHVLAVARPYSGRIAVSGPSPNRPFDQALAQASLATGDVRAAADYADLAVAASRQRNTPTFLARELIFLAEARRRAGAGDTELRPLVDEALRIADELGLAVVRADVERYQLPH